MRNARSVPMLAAALGIAAAAAGCSGTGQTAPAHPDSPHSPAARPCPARPGQAAITLTDTAPRPVLTAPPGSRIVVTVPPWGWGTATDVTVGRGGILREQCTVLLPGGGRRTVFLAVRPGSTWIAATVEPASDLAMPAWFGDVTVRAGRD
jgi:hypothetical protein